MSVTMPRSIATRHKIKVVDSHQIMAPLHRELNPAGSETAELNPVPLSESEVVMTALLTRIYISETQIELALSFISLSRTKNKNSTRLVCFPRVPGLTNENLT